jgi:hypothetical protein
VGATLGAPGAARLDASDRSLTLSARPAHATAATA